MKKIEFGFANEKNPSGSWQGIGINSEVPLTEAEYYGALKFRGTSYVVAKVTEDKYGRWPNLVGRFIVRPAVADIYSDGSGVIFLEQEQSLNGNQLENFLNNPQFKEKIHNLDDIVNFIKNGITKNNEPFDACAVSDVYLTTSIKHEEFEKIQMEAGLAVTQEVNYEQQLETPQLSQRQLVADQAKQALAKVVGIDFVNEHESDRGPLSELNKELSNLQLEIYNLSDEMALAMVKICDRIKLEEARKQLYSNITYDRMAYHREQYTDLFDYLNSQTSEKAEDISLSERKIDSGDAQKVGLPETQELLEGEHQSELSPVYSNDQSLEEYAQLEQRINDNPNLSEEKKREMRDALWADFDNFVERNPEQGKQR